MLGLPSVPYAIAVGEVHPWIAITLTSLGMIGGMTLVAMGSAWLAGWLSSRAAAKGRQSKLTSLAERAQPIVSKFGLPGLGLIGIFVFGTSSSALIGTILGLPRRPLLVWLSIGVLFWSTFITYGLTALISVFRG